MARKFGRKKEEAIAALLSHESIEDAARCGWSEYQYAAAMAADYREFKTRVSQGPARGGPAKRWRRLQQAMGAAGVTILKLMTDVNVPAAVRLRAAECVFDCGIKGIEVGGYRRALCGAGTCRRSRTMERSTPEVTSNFLRRLQRLKRLDEQEHRYGIANEAGESAKSALTDPVGYTAQATNGLTYSGTAGSLPSDLARTMGDLVHSSDCGVCTGIGEISTRSPAMMVSSLSAFRRRRWQIVAANPRADDQPKPISPIGTAGGHGGAFGHSTRDHGDLCSGWFAGGQWIPNRGSVAGGRVAKNVH